MKSKEDSSSNRHTNALIHDAEIEPKIHKRANTETSCKNAFGYEQRIRELEDKNSRMERPIGAVKELNGFKIIEEAKKSIPQRKEQLPRSPVPNQKNFQHSKRESATGDTELDCHDTLHNSCQSINCVDDNSPRNKTSLKSNSLQKPYKFDFGKPDTMEEKQIDNRNQSVEGVNDFGGSIEKSQITNAKPFASGKGRPIAPSNPELYDHNTYTALKVGFNQPRSQFRGPSGSEIRRSFNSAGQTSQVTSFGNGRSQNLPELNPQKDEARLEQDSCDSNSSPDSEFEERWEEFVEKRHLESSFRKDLLGSNSQKYGDIQKVFQALQRMIKM